MKKIVYDTKVPFPFLLIIIYIFLIGMYGMTLNFNAIQSNNGKMPVAINQTFSPYHITINENTSNIHLTDIYYFKGVFYSIGDILMFAFLFSFNLFLICIIIYIFYKNRKLIKLKTTRLNIAKLKKLNK